jgi:hypothetical protein
MALKFAKTVGGVGRKLELVKLANTQTVEVGDVIQTYSAGLGTLGSAGTPLLGVIHALCDSKGMPIQVSDPVAGTASSTDTLSVATGTAGVSYALVDCGKDSIYSAAVTGTLGTTVSSTLRGCWIDVDSAGTEYGKVLESTATRTRATETNFYSWGVDPNDSTRLLVSISQSELDSQTT